MSSDVSPNLVEPEEYMIEDELYVVTNTSIEAVPWIVMLPVISTFCINGWTYDDVWTYDAVWAYDELSAYEDEITYEAVWAFWT